MKGIGLFTAGLGLLAMSACTHHIEEPWVSGDQYAQERQRAATQQDALRQRLTTVQADR